MELTLVNWFFIFIIVVLVVDAIYRLVKPKCKHVYFPTVVRNSNGVTTKYICSKCGQELELE